MQGGKIPKRSISGAYVSRTLLESTLSKAAMNRGMDDPVACETGWSIRQVERFRSRLPSYPGYHLGEIRTRAFHHSKTSASKAKYWFKRCAVSLGLMVAAAVTAPLLGPVAYGVGSGAGLFGLVASTAQIVTYGVRGLKANRTVRDLDIWGVAFEKQRSRECLDPDFDGSSRSRPFPKHHTSGPGSCWALA